MVLLLDSLTWSCTGKEGLTTGGLGTAIKGILLACITGARTWSSQGSKSSPLSHGYCCYCIVAMCVSQAVLYFHSCCSSGVGRQVMEGKGKDR